MFIPHTESEEREMLKVIGLQHIEDLFQDIPPSVKFPSLSLPPALTEMEILADLQMLSQANLSTNELSCFLGAGAYKHYIPAAVDAILRRSEFYTAYTPYQAEISQGTLQSIFEYQSLIAALTGMDASNASHYDGATATAEAILLAYHHFREKRTKVILSPALNPQYKAVARTYTQGFEKMTLLGDEEENLASNMDSLIDLLDDQVMLVVVQYPDYFGRIYDYAHIVSEAHAVGALVAFVCNPIALGLLKSPGELGADIVVGEGQPLGIPLSFGGPYLGFFSTTRDLIRKMSGRLVGETLDRNGQRAYVLTLTAREQHIRRERATSNICTNQGLLTLASAVYLSLLGKHGLRQVANLCYQKAHYAAQKISKIPGYSLIFKDSQFFHEFLIHCPKPVAEINAHLLDHGILGGYDISKVYPSRLNQMLVAVTEMNTRDEIDKLCDALKEISHE
jgi:glycine dehydrogenase subunit 1